MSAPAHPPGEQPHHAPPKQDKPSLPIMELHTDYKRPDDANAESTPSKPSSPTPASLYSQLQAAQAQEGTQAAAAILLARSREMLGVSQDPLSMVDEATKTRLANEGAELKNYADLLMKTPQAEAVTTMWSNLATKYSHAGSGLQNEALNLWTQLYSSSEATELGKTSADLLKQWQDYAATTEGHQMLEQSTNLLKSQSGVLAHLLQGLTTTVLAPAAASSTSDSLSAPSASSTAADGAPQPLITPTAMASSAAMMNATKKVNKALADDEDVKELIARSSNLLKSYSADPLSKSASPAMPAKSPSAKSATSPASKSGSDAAAAPENPTAIASDAAGVALTSGAEYLKSLRESEVGNKMLAKGLVMLQANKDLLTPENLTSFSSTLTSDSDQRQNFITKTKDIALEFLLSYLPSVVVPPIVGEKDRIAYEIGNIDLGGFKVDSENVIVTVDTAGAIEVRATGITCAMKNLIWSYKKLSFPKLSGKGTADAMASEVEFVLKLKIAYPKEKKKSAATEDDSKEKKSGSPSKSGAASSSSSSKAISPIPSSSSSSTSSSPTKRPSRSEEEAAARERSKSASVAQMKTRVVDALTPTMKSKQLEGTSADSSSTAAPATSSTAVTPPTAEAVPVSTLPSSMGAAILSTVSMDIGKPQLVMDSCHITLKKFDILIHTGFFKAAYNLLLKLFKDTVTSTLENTLNQELILRSVYLLDTLNALAVDYLPILQRIAIKASTAAMAEDTPTGEDGAVIVASSAPPAAAVPAEAAPSAEGSQSLADFYGIAK